MNPTTDELELLLSNLADHERAKTLLLRAFEDNRPASRPASTSCGTKQPSEGHGSTMRIDRLILENFRGFERLDLSFDEHLTVLAGVNGAGKSSALEGLAVAAGAWLLGFRSISARGIGQEDVRLVQQDFSHPTAELQFPCRVVAEGWAGDNFTWAREKASERGRTTSTEAAELKSAASEAQGWVSAGQPVDLPVIAYYGAGRPWVQRRESRPTKLGPKSRTVAYHDCLDPASTQKRFEAWMRQQEQARIQRIAEELDNGVSDDTLRPPALEAVQRASARMFDDVERLYYDVGQDELRLAFRDGRRQPFRLLSDGYRNLVATVADIAWRAVQLNPHLGAQAPTEARGVVLIDEIELHLHPSWQQGVLKRLLDIFPNIQFVVTTHAPLIIASTPASQLRFLDEKGTVHEVGVARGLTVNTVLQNLMGVEDRPDPETRTSLAELAVVLEQGDLKAARTRFEALRAQLGDLDPELLALEWELRDLEVNGASD